MEPMTKKFLQGVARPEAFSESGFCKRYTLKLVSKPEMYQFQLKMDTPFTVESTIPSSERHEIFDNARDVSPIIVHSEDFGHLAMDPKALL
jgi:hypothetical protein